MYEITQIRKLSIWIFFIPLTAINLCLFISQNPEFLHDTIFAVDQIGRSGFSIPYIDGSLSISRASRTFPQYLIFKPSMILTSFLLYYYWKNNNDLVNKLYETKINFKFKIFGILSAIFLAIHSIFLGIKFDIQVYKLFRRIVLVLFILFELIAQGYLVYHFYKLKKKLEKFVVKKILIMKILLVSILVLTAILSLPTLITKGNTHFKHMLEWNYFVGVILFYLFSRFFWRRTT